MELREVHRVLENQTGHAIQRNGIASIGQGKGGSRSTENECRTSRNVDRIRWIHNAPHVAIRRNRDRCAHGIGRIGGSANRQDAARRITHDIPTNIDGRSRRVVKLDEFSSQRAEFANDHVAHLVRRHGGNATGQIANVERPASRIVGDVGLAGHHVAGVNGTGDHVIDNNGRIRRNAVGAHIARAGIAVDGNIGVVNGGRIDVAHAIALTGSAIADQRIADGCAAGRVVESTRTADTRTGSANGIHSWTIGGDHALWRRDTHASAVALRAAILVAHRADGQVRMRGRACYARFAGALHTVVRRDVGIVVDIGRDATHAIALIGSAITDDRIGNNRTGGRIVDATGPGSAARTGLARRIGPALSRHVALHALARCIAE